MCGRFNILDNQPTTELLEEFGLADGLKQYLPLYNMEPKEQIPIIIEHDGHYVLEAAIWWFVLTRTPEGLRADTNWRTFNAVARTLEKRPAYRGAFKTARCIIPASGYYEFLHQKAGKAPYYIRPVDKALAFAGLYREHKHNGEIVFSCTLVTTTPHPRLEFLNKKSQPVILPPEAYDAWLDSSNQDTEQFKALFEPKFRSDFVATPMVKYVNRAGNQGKDCMKPAGEPHFIRVQKAA